jgi:hypothetical protein
VQRLVGDVVRSRDDNPVTGCKQQRFEHLGHG